MLIFVLWQISDLPGHAVQFSSGTLWGKKEKGMDPWLFLIHKIGWIHLSYETKLKGQSEQLAANLNLLQSELALGLKPIQMTKIKFEKCILLPFWLLACDQNCEKDVPKHCIFTEYFLNDQNCEALEFTHGFQWDIQTEDIWINLICNVLRAFSHHWSEEKLIKLSTRQCSKM